VREVVARAKTRIAIESKQTILFIDEIHRFSKAQQDAFLPHVENGTIILIGATTENPSFEVIWPLLSRMQIYVLYPLSDAEIEILITRVLKADKKIKLDKDARLFLIEYANGDVRKVFNAIEMTVEIDKHITIKLLEEVLQRKYLGYDKKGENHFDTISAFIKSMRGGQPDAVLHYLARMIKAGEDPVFIARRLVIFAAEDIGNAQPTALVVATSCMQAVHMVGMPESSLILAQTSTYLATAKKSIASTLGIQQALKDLEIMKVDLIPLHLRNAATALLKKLGYGAAHVRYPWLVEKKTGRKVSQEYMPKNLIGKKYYEPDWK
jgi:putative ATPase